MSDDGVVEQAPVDVSVETYTVDGGEGPTDADLAFLGLGSDESKPVDPVETADQAVAEIPADEPVEEPAEDPDDPDLPAGVVLPNLEDLGPQSDVAALKAEIAELKALITGKAAAPVVPTAEEPLVSENEYEDAMRDPKAFNDLMRKVYRSAQAEAAAQVDAKIAQQAVVTKFYSDNPDLSAHAQTVQKVTERILAVNPGLPLSTLLPLAASQTRKTLKLPLVQARSGNAPQKKTPKLPRVGGVAGKPSANPTQPSRMEQEIAELLKYAGKE